MSWSQMTCYQANMRIVRTKEVRLNWNVGECDMTNWADFYDTTTEPEQRYTRTFVCNGKCRASATPTSQVPVAAPVWLANVTSGAPTADATTPLVKLLVAWNLTRKLASGTRRKHDNRNAKRHPRIKHTHIHRVREANDKWPPPRQRCVSVLFMSVQPHGADEI